MIATKEKSQTKNKVWFATTLGFNFSVLYFVPETQFLKVI
jgi:hypothetical protein